MCMMKEKIPISWLDLAQQPVDSPYWKANDGTEYFYYADNKWLVTNEFIGPYRVRGIYKLVKEFKVSKKLNNEIKGK